MLHILASLCSLQWPTPAGWSIDVWGFCLFSCEGPLKTPRSRGSLTFTWSYLSNLHSGKYYIKINVEFILLWRTLEIMYGLWIDTFPAHRRKHSSWGRRSLPTKSEWACDLERNETRSLTLSSALLPPEDTALMQDTAGWLYLSIDQMVKRTSCSCHISRGAKFFTCCKYSFWIFTWCLGCSKGAIHILLIWLCIKRQMILKNIPSLWKILWDTNFPSIYKEIMECSR